LAVVSGGSAGSGGTAGTESVCRGFAGMWPLVLGGSAAVVSGGSAGKGDTVGSGGLAGTGKVCRGEERWLGSWCLWVGKIGSNTPARVWTGCATCTTSQRFVGNVSAVRGVAGRTRRVPLKVDQAVR
jgi:hypothetical protein